MQISRCKLDTRHACNIVITEKGFLILQAETILNYRLMYDVISKISLYIFIMLTLHHVKDVLWLQVTNITGSTNMGRNDLIDHEQHFAWQAIIAT